MSYQFEKLNPADAVLAKLYDLSNAQPEQKISGGDSFESGNDTNRLPPFRAAGKGGYISQREFSLRNYHE